MTPNLGGLSVEDLSAWLAALREASAATPADAAARAYELEAQRVELELQNRELRRTQIALVESNARYRDLYDFAPVAYLTLGTNGEIREANLTAATLLGVERGRLIGRPLVSHISPRDRELFREHLQRCFEQGVKVSHELRVSVRGGEDVTTHVISAPLQAEDGAPIGCKTTLADISLIKRGEARLGLLARASLLLAAPLVDDVPCDEVVRLLVPQLADIAALDLLDDRGQPQRVAFACSSVALERRAGAAAQAAPPREAEELAARAAGEPLFLPDCSPSNLAEQGLDADPLLVGCGATSAFLVPVRTRVVNLGVLTLVATDRRRRFEVADRTVAQDFAARLALALHNARLYRDAREAVKAREEVLAFVAHDMRNPVHGILLSLATVLDDPPKEERRRGWQRLDRVRRITEQMNRMIDDLLDLSSLDAGHLTLETKDCDVQEVIQEVYDSLGPLIADKGIRLDLELPTGSDRVRCDPARILQVFSNLVGNAVKFTPAGGQITVLARPTPHEVVFSVADTGKGVEAPDLARLFDRYWQADQHAHKGRGLGLYIARKIVEAQGGRIWAESQRGLGTTLYFTLPRAPTTSRTKSDLTGAELRPVDRRPVVSRSSDR